MLRDYEGKCVAITLLNGKRIWGDVVGAADEIYLELHYVSPWASHYQGELAPDFIPRMLVRKDQILSIEDRIYTDEKREKQVQKMREEDRARHHSTREY